MQVGEPVTAGATSSSPDKELAAELLSVTFRSPVKVSRDRKTIEGPHWQRGTETEHPDDWASTAVKAGLPPEPYARRAAVYLVAGAAASHDVEVKLRVTRSENVTGPATLSGNLRGLAIVGDCPTAAGEHTIVARIVTPPNEIHAYRGHIGWMLSVAGEGVHLSLGAMLAEVYFILGSPRGPFARSGVWAEVLRFACGRLGVVGEREASAVTAKITVYCHSGHSLRYESKHGGPRFGVGGHGGRFKVSAYMLRTRSTCNCYDQAAAIQTFAAAVGVVVGWRYLAPFGYIKTTNLVGVGSCNNPFFGSDDSKKVVAADSPERSAFGNHAFVEGNATSAFDACAGPHPGEETLFQYLSASIDDTPTLYRKRFRPGRVCDIVSATGVSSVA